MSEKQNLMFMAPTPQCEHKTELQQVLQTVEEIKKAQTEQREQSNALIYMYIYIYVIYFIYCGISYACESMYAVDPAEVSPYMASAPPLSSMPRTAAPVYQPMTQVGRAGL